MILRMMVLAFLLGLLVGCESRPSTDEFMVVNDCQVKILAVHGREVGYALIVEGVNNKRRTTVYGDYDTYAPLVGEVVLIKKDWYRNSPHYEVVGPAGKREQ